MKLHTAAVTKELPCFEKVAALAKEAFPPEEYLAPEKLIEMAEEGDQDFLALYDKEHGEDIFVGFMVVKKYKQMRYLFFLAIDPTNRSKGYGGRAIKTLVSLYPDSQQIVDLEMLDETAENHIQREKRRQFYLKNGYKPTGQYLSYLGVDYEVLCMDDNFKFEDFKEMMSTLKVDGFNPVYFRK